MKAPENTLLGGGWPIAAVILLLGLANSDAQAEESACQAARCSASATIRIVIRIPERSLTTDPAEQTGVPPVVVSDDGTTVASP